jgi:hypothetical protein
MFDLLIAVDFVGQPQRGGMFIDIRSQKTFLAPAGRYIPAQSLLTELESFFVPEL